MENESNAVQIAQYLEYFQHQYIVAGSIGVGIANRKIISKNEEFDLNLNFACIFGAADSFAISIGASQSDTLNGINLWVIKSGNGASAYNRILVAGSIPQLQHVVQWSGEAVRSIILGKLDPAAAFLGLIFKLQDRYGPKKAD